MQEVARLGMEGCVTLGEIGPNVARLAIPMARVRLAAGRTRLTREGQALCFFAGANSIFYGDKLLTAQNPAADADVALLQELGLKIDPNEKDTTTSRRH